MKILSVVGTRPNLVKIAPFVTSVRAFNQIAKKSDQINHILLHTGQHYSCQMHESLLTELEIPVPDYNLEIGSGSHAEQLGKTMIAFEKVLKRELPDWVVVVGDVNATLSCSIIAKKEKIKVCHIEAGLRSGDLSMPEEINRIVADHMSDLLLTPDIFSSKNLEKEGFSKQKVHFAGNIMIDSLERFRSKATRLSSSEIVQANQYSGKTIPGNIKSLIDEGDFVLFTIHRPSNVDNKEVLESLANWIVNDLSERITVIWPIHPRTEKNLIRFGLKDILEQNEKVVLCKPINYASSLKLNSSARVLITDSGGLQEEATIFGTPCIVLRNNTERPVTLVENGGTSILSGNDINNISKELSKAISRDRLPFRPALWDGKTADRCLSSILNYQINTF